jgi:hypothetical protein
MPGIWTHILFCEEVLDRVTGPLPFTHHETFMKLGAQGPNLFHFYHFPLRSRGEKTEQAIKQILAHKQCSDFMTDLIKAAKQEKPQVRAYVFGFVTHCLLHKHTQPYIAYHTNDNKGRHYKQFEVNIDTLMMKKYHNLQTWKAPVHKEIDVGMKLNKDVTRILDEVIENYSPGTVMSSYIQKSYRNMKIALKLYSDPLKWKSKVFPSFVSAYFHQPIEDKIDYLNLKKSTWYNTDVNRPSTASFVELFEAARAQSLGLMFIILDYWTDENIDAEKKLDAIRKCIIHINQKEPQTP